ncbi:hypothetical protein P8V03_00330 [Clostridium sp. A1-XYC3]|uniref:Uncharacterized protein n=1 Tax=Clostridium tanneri TaxID=3037988 RepID=A0ABU4JN74_9CLOT|nr:hypothetical protein [Clostridium sp. A1-XYC3]MDW8799595.1 hypothetical protein [Clostridium sp. A1-XYC3]
MNKGFFLPQWYLESKLNRKRKVMKLCIMAIVIVNIVLTDFLIIKLNKVKSLDNRINETKLYNEGNYSGKNKGDMKECKTLDTLSQVNKIIETGIPFKQIYIKNKKVDIQISSEEFNYISLIKNIEEEEEFIIKNLVLPEEQNNKEIRISIELR